jgi:adenosylhomocysteine nucleosidase
MGKPNNTIGILVPMQEEVELLLSDLAHAKKIELASRIFYKGNLCGKEIVLAKSGIGKVASSFTASLLIHHFGVQSVLVTGVAGGISDAIKVGDLAIATQAVQHDMDCSPLFPKFEIPATGITYFESDKTLTKRLKDAAYAYSELDFKNQISTEVRIELGIQKPTIHSGLLVSGDQFIGTIQQWNKIRTELPESLFVEMEGAAVAQVCYDSNIPWCSIRTISDKANAVAHLDFNLFLNHAAKIYTAGVVKRFLEKL